MMSFDVKDIKITEVRAQVACMLNALQSDSAKIRWEYPLVNRGKRSER